MLIEIYGVKEARSRIAEAVEAHEAEAHATAAAKAWALEGADRVRKGSPYSRAKTLEDRRRLNPRYAGEAEAVEAAIAGDASFRARYATARDQWLAGSATSCARGHLRHEAVTPGPLRATGRCPSDLRVRLQPSCGDDDAAVTA